MTDVMANRMTGGRSGGRRAAACPGYMGVQNGKPRRRRTGGRRWQCDAGTGRRPLMGLHKSLREVQAVGGVDLTIAPGEVVAVLGPNGAGKSTTIDLILGLTSRTADRWPSSGRIRLRAVRAGRVGAMLQSGALLPDVTVRELVSTFAALHRHPMPVRGGACGGPRSPTSLASRRRSCPAASRSGFGTPWPWCPIRICWCWTSRRSPWMSRCAGRSGVPCASSPNSGRTVLFATHYLEEADDFADRVVVLARGRIVADGTGAQIKATVTGRTISAVVAADAADAGAGFPGWSRWSARARGICCAATIPMLALRAMLTRFDDARDIEISAGNLEDAFLELTGDSHARPARQSTERAS